MCEPAESSQLNAWLFTHESLDLCRARANRVARKWITSMTTDSPASSITDETKLSNVSCFARSFKAEKYQDEDDGPWQSPSRDPYLNPTEEAALVSFYASMLPRLIGPHAETGKLRRGESKVPATAALLLRRFFLSNSVMVYDPKTIMVAAAFLASKVEDATCLVRYLEEGTNVMNAPVSHTEIIPAEIALLSGIHFDLLCFHPFKAVLAITEDLRTYLKSEKGRALVRWTKNPTSNRAIVGQDLIATHDAAQQIVKDAIVSDIPLLYPPGQVGFAAMMVANEEQQKQAVAAAAAAKNDAANNDGNAANTNTNTGDVPQIDMMGYLSQRFQDQPSRLEGMETELRNICNSLRQLKEGEYGCANHKLDLQTLKGIHKKLKKVRVWGVKEKKKKRTNESSNGGGGGDDGAPESKKTKTSS